MHQLGLGIAFSNRRRRAYFRVDAEGQGQLNASTGADEPGANKCINWGSDAAVLVGGGGQEQTSASTENGANACIH